MKYSVIRETDIASGTGVRVSLWVSGCPHHCYKCFNPETWDESYGMDYTTEVEQHVIDLVRRSYCAGLTLIGGEPLTADHQVCLYSLVQAVHALKNKTIWCYTGYTWDTLPHTEVTDALLTCIDVLVDGPYVDAERNPILKFRGSNNQRLIAVPETLRTGNVVLYEK